MNVFFRLAAETALAQAQASKDRGGHRMRERQVGSSTGPVSASPLEIGETPGRPVTHLDERRKS